MSDITPEKVAAAACDGAGGWLESLQGALSVTAEGSVLSLSVAMWDKEGNEGIQHFRAVVVEGDTDPIVLPRPDLTDGYEFEGDHYDDHLHTGWQVCAVNSDARPVGVKFADSILFRGSGHITTAEARRFAAALVAKADAVEAAQAEQERQP
ncbi:hypothetical protein [Nonomuraea wenchangensis]|uniref:hypothetical protein n=1 Tax=Nonomuraea wenchangensis TaxID=568860 RepID=UPI00331CDE23